MPTVKELREKQARILTNARAKFDEIAADTPAERAAEIEREFDAMMADHDKVGELITRAEKLEESESRAGAGDPRRPTGGNDEQRGSEGGDVTYRSAFYRMLATGGDVSELTGEERAALRGGVVRDQDVARRMQTAGTAGAGGYTVPTELATIIDRALKDWGPMYDEAISTEMNTASGNPVKIPTVDDTAKSAGTHTEGTALTDDGSEDATFGQAALDAYVADTEWVKWSFELAQDSIFNVEQLLGSLLGERLARKANAWLTVGTGVSQPHGIVTASSLGVTAASDTAIDPDELIDLQHSVNAAYRRSPKCRWMFADSTLKALRKLKDGDGNYLWQMGDVKTGAPATLLDKPYAINDDVPAIATGNRAILFGDFGRYYVRKVGAPIIGVVRERFWPDLGIAGLIRLDGEIGQSGAIKHLKLA
jgi:HK97 family phage major capsid protein